MPKGPLRARKAGLRMLARWLGEAIQSPTTSSGVRRCQRGDQKAMRPAAMALGGALPSAGTT